MEDLPLRPDPAKPFLFVTPNDPEPSAEDPERFIRHGFSQDPQLGCELLYHRYYANLCSHAIRFVFSKEVAEDIVSEVFLTFWKNRTFERISTSYGGYLYRAVRNRSYNYLQHELNRTRPLGEPDEADLADPDTPEAMMNFHELIQRLDAEIQALPPQCRRAFMLNRYEGKRYTDIADELHISQKAVEHLISRALARLRAHLVSDWLILFSLSFFF